MELFSIRIQRTFQLVSTGFMEQLEFLSGKSGILPLRLLQERKKIPRVSGFEDVKVTELSHEALKSYLKERGIDPAIAGRFCKEVAYGIRGKRYFAIGFMNRSGGYELRNPMFKGCISPKDISCVSLSGKKQDTCCVFEGKHSINSPFHSKNVILLL